MGKRCAAGATLPPCAHGRVKQHRSPHQHVGSASRPRNAGWLQGSPPNRLEWALRHTTDSRAWAFRALASPRAPSRHQRRKLGPASWKVGPHGAEMDPRPQAGCRLTAASQMTPGETSRKPPCWAQPKVLTRSCELRKLVVFNHNLLRWFLR